MLNRHGERFPDGMGRRFAVAYAALFIPFAVCTPYLQVLLKARGYRDGDIGLIQGTLEVMAVLAPPLWGYLSDWSGRPRALLACAVLGSLPAFLLFGVTQHLLAALGVAILFGLFSRPAIPLTDGLTFRYLHLRGGDYGTVRAAGSVSFIVVVIILECAGIAGTNGARTILWAMATACGIHLFSVFALPGDGLVHDASARDRSRGPGIRVFLTRGFIVFTLSAFLGRVAMMGYYHFFTLYLRRDLDFPAAGYLWMLGPLSEIPVIYFSTAIMARIGVRRLFALGLLGIVVRLAGFSLAASVWQVALLQSLHALTFGAYHVASVTFVSRAAPVHLKSSAQTVFSAVTVGLGGLCGGALGGFVAERWGYRTMYGLLGGISMAGLLILVTMMPRERTQAATDSSSH